MKVYLFIHVHMFFRINNSLILKILINFFLKMLLYLFCLRELTLLLSAKLPRIIESLLYMYKYLWQIFVGEQNSEFQLNWGI